MSSVGNKPGLFEQIGGALGGAVGGAVDAAVDTVGGVAGSIAESVVEDFSKVGDELSNGNVIGAAAELMDAGSLGTGVANALDALGMVPSDPFAKNVVSAAVNLASSPLNPMGVLAGLKDMNDASMALAAKGKQTAPAHTPPRPAVALENAQAVRRPGYPAAAEADVQVNISQPRPGLRPGCKLPEFNNWMKEHPKFFHAPPKGCINIINDQFQEAFDKIGFKPNGPSCRDKPINERSVADILNDPSLCFEDMVAMFMAKVMDDMEKDVKEQMKKMEAMKSGGKGNADQASTGTNAQGSGETGRAGKGSQAGAAQSSQVDEKFDPLKDALAGGAGMLRDAAPMLGGILEIGAAVAPIVGTAIGPAVGGAVGAALGSVFPGVGTAVCGTIGTMVGAALPVVLPMLFQGAADLVKGGALDGVADMMDGGATGGNKKAESRLVMDSSGHAGGTKQAAKGGTTKEGATAEKDSESFTMEMEKLKMLMQRMQQMQQALSNVLNTMHQGAMNAIRNIK